MRTPYPNELRITNRETYSNELMHYGILGMKWGVRRYQNPDGTLTEAGKKRYGSGNNETYRYRADLHPRSDGTRFYTMEKTTSIGKNSVSVSVDVGDHSVAASPDGKTEVYGSSAFRPLEDKALQNRLDECNGALTRIKNNDWKNRKEIAQYMVDNWSSFSSLSVDEVVQKIYPASIRFDKPIGNVFAVMYADYVPKDPDGWMLLEITLDQNGNIIDWWQEG